MGEILISVAAKVAECFVPPVLHQARRHARFLFCAGKIKRNLESAKADLIKKKESIENKKKEARKKNENTVKKVEEWFTEVSNVMAKVWQLEEQMKEASSCCWGWCSTLKGYRLCKKFAKITDSMKHLNENAEITPFSEPIPIQDTVFFSSEKCECFESTKSAFNQLWEALRDDSVHMISLYGMGGCGKTTLAKEVGKKAKELFDHVIFAVVSQTITVERIQDEIADSLRYRFERRTPVGRAGELSLRLQSGEGILIILDDVWAKVNLNEIGIPLPEKNHNRYKILLTTRLQRVCTSMNCDKSIPLRLLSDNEALTLFQKNTRIVDDHLAQEIVGECKGLPIAIVAVARALKGRSSDWWKVALEKLKTSTPIDVDENEKDAYSCLELSYNFLRENEAKLLLKICSMFAEDYKIPFEELFRYAIGLGMYERVDSFDSARNRVNMIVEDLIESSLLLPCHNENNGGEKYFNIHDVVRDTILWIASKDHNIIMVDPKRGFSAIADNESLKDCYAVSFWRWEGTDQFPEHLDAPKLEFLLLNSLHQLDFSHASFEHMKELKLMSLLQRDEVVGLCPVILSLPLSTQWKCFNNLHTLRLVNQQIGDISFVENLTRLKILDLAGSIFKKLPNGIADKCELKLMDLSECNIEEKEDCSEVIGRCKQLQELYMPPKIALPQECFMSNTFPKLQRYRLNICNRNFGGYRLVDFDCAREFRFVSIGNMNMSNLCGKIGDLLERASSVCVNGPVGVCKSIIPDFVLALGTTNELTKLYLYSCSEMACVLDTTTFDNADSSQVDAKFPTLVKLVLHNMGNLKEVVRGPPSLRFTFEKLKSLSIEDCPNLTSLFPSSVAQFLPQLEYLNVRNCYELKHIVVKEENEIDADEMEIFPHLKHIHIDGCIHLEDIFPISVVRTLLSLENMVICGCTQLKHIIKNEGEGTSMTHGIRNNEECRSQSTSQPCFPKLRELTVTDCHELKSLFSLSIAAQLSQLEELYISNAEQLEQAFGYKNKDVSCNTEKIILPNLSELRLEMLPKFVSICSELKIHAVKLRLMHVRKCPEFNSVHEWSTQGQVINDRQVYNEVSYLDGSSFEEEQKKVVTPNLGLLLLDDLPGLMFIWKGATFINFQNLVRLRVSACGKLKFIFPTCAVRNLTTLESLIISDCEELEEIFGYASERHEYDGKVIELALPKLTKLQLFRLPRFTNFGENLQFQFKFQALKCYEVQDCPKLSPTTHATVKNISQSHNTGNKTDDESEDATLQNFWSDLEDNNSGYGCFNDLLDLLSPICKELSK